MRITLSLMLAFVAAFLLSAPQVEARGGGGGRGGGGARGGGGFGGGGMSRPGGGFGGGGMQRPSGSMNRNFGGSGMGGGGNFGGGAANFGGGAGNFGGAGGRGASSFGGFSGESRAGNAFGGGGDFGGANRGGFGNDGGLSRGAYGNEGALNRGAYGNAFGAGIRGGFDGNLSGRDAFEPKGAYGRANDSQLNNFLDLPGGSGSAFSGDHASTLPAGDGTKSWTTPGGSTITAGKGSGSYTTARGTTIGGAGAGIKVEGPGGNTYAKGVGGIGASNGPNSAFRAGSATGVQGRNGYAAVNFRGAAGVNGNVRAGSATAIRGPGGTTVAAGRGAAFTNGQFVGGNTWSAVNGSYRHWNYYSPGWYGRYPGCWWPGRWAVGATAWAVADWASASAYCGMTTEPVYYDYGTNVVYGDDGNVYQGDTSVGTAAEYYDQASQIAADGSESTNEEWMPLGVFAIVSDESQKTSDKTIQLALNEEGVIRGNLQDSLADTVKPVSGSVDKKTQRVAFSIEGNDKAVIETGLYNLTNDEVPVLVHLGPDHVEKHFLVRLKQPEMDK